MEFKENTRVLAYNGQDVGFVGRVVLNPKTKEVTHIIVRKGFLFTEDKLVPLKVIASATPNHVTLRLDAAALDALPPFEETHYVPLNEAEIQSAAYPPDMALPLYWYLPLGGWADYAPYPPAFRPEVHRNIAEDEVAVKEGAQVVSADGVHVGDVERVIVDEAGDRVISFWISQGFLLKEQKIVPVSWIRDIAEDEIHLSVGASLIETLREPQPE